MAVFVVQIGMAPSEYNALTFGEREAILREARRRK